jgi:quinone-modifying oxidoreductase, subunit QmoC
VAITRRRFLRRLWPVRNSAADLAPDGLGAAPQPRPLPETDHQHTDFGWRLHGRMVGVLPDRSYRLAPADDSTEAALDPYRANLNSLQACLQCGACTASCGLVGEQSLFPRRQMNLFQMEQYELLIADPAVWYCYNCGDCSTRCATKAKPGQLMGAVRQMAVERFAFPAFMAGLVNRPRRWWVLFALAAALLLGVMAVGGSFSPVTDRVQYASMMPHLTLNVFFFALTGLVLAATMVGAARAWRTYQVESVWRAKPGALVRAFRVALADVLAHRRLSDCVEHRWRGRAHLAVFYGFAGLAGLAGVAAFLIATGGDYPFPIAHPLKILGHLAAFLLIGGTTYYVVERSIAAARGDGSTYFDWLLLVNLLLVGITGVFCEALRYLNVAAAAYPVYFLHLNCVFVFVIGLPYSKLAHVCYRTLALTSREYDARLKAEAAGQIASGRPAGVAGTVPAAGLASRTALGG